MQQMNPGQIQMLLNISERFGILLAENLDEVTIESENISMCCLTL